MENNYVLKKWDFLNSDFYLFCFEDVSQRLPREVVERSCWWYTPYKAGDAGTWDIYLLPTCCWPWTLGFSQSCGEPPPLPQRPGVWLNQAGLASVSRMLWWGSNGYVHLSQNSVGNLIARILMMSGTTLTHNFYYTAMPAVWKRISTPRPVGYGV